MLSSQTLLASKTYEMMGIIIVLHWDSAELVLFWSLCGPRPVIFCILLVHPSVIMLSVGPALKWKLSKTACDASTRSPIISASD